MDDPSLIKNEMYIFLETVTLDGSPESSGKKCRPVIIEVKDLKSFKRAGPSGGNQVTLLLKDGTTHNPLWFQGDAFDGFANCLRKYLNIRR